MYVWDNEPLFDSALDSVMDFLAYELSSQDFDRLATIELTPANLRRFAGSLGDSHTCQGLEDILSSL
jgi:hypothetical protein